MQTAIIWIAPVLGRVRAGGMDSSSAIALWTSRKERGKPEIAGVHAEVDCIDSRQVNIDYSVCQALRWCSEGLVKCRIIYDIACQYHKKFKQRVQLGRYLGIPEDLLLEWAIGKFHIGGHILDCFPEFSLNFILGAAQIDGEILETLWAALNKISGSTRAMSKAHRSEVLNAHMNDSNWKKLVGIVAALCTKYEKAVEGLEETEDALEELEEHCPLTLLAKWREAERAALTARGKAMQIYQVREDEGASNAINVRPEILLLNPGDNLDSNDARGGRAYAQRGEGERRPIIGECGMVVGGDCNPGRTVSGLRGRETCV